MEPQQNGKTKRTSEPRLTIRVSAKTHKRLRLIAAEQETSAQALIEPLIDQLVNTTP